MFCNILILTADTPESTGQQGQAFFLNSHCRLEDALKQVNYWTLRYSNVAVVTHEKDYMGAVELADNHSLRAPWGFQLTRRDNGQTEFSYRKEA